MRVVTVCMIISVLCTALSQGVRAAQIQTQTKLDGTNNLEFDVVDPSNPTVPSTFKMGKDGAIKLPSGAGAQCDASHTYNTGAIRWNDTVTPGVFEGCDGIKWIPLYKSPALFGGYFLYEWCGGGSDTPGPMACRTPNPATGACSCPAGITAVLISASQTLGQARCAGYTNMAVNNNGYLCQTTP
jgi:hypothetical protein